MLTTKPNSTRDAFGAHVESGMYVVYRTYDVRARVHGITDYGDVVINLVTGGLPITTRGVHLEVEVRNIKCAHCKSYHQSIGEVKDCGRMDNASKVFADIDAAPVKSTAAKSVDVPPGRYAIAQDGVLKFYHVSRPTEGRWAGATFVKQQVSDDLHRVYSRAARTVLEIIAEDILGASTRYGKEIGICGVCGRTLTNAESRAAGIGPVCRDKFNVNF